MTRQKERRPIHLHPVVLVSILGLAAACVSPPEVKQASSELTTIYESLDAAEGTFRKALLGEMARTSKDLERAVVARAIKARVDQLSALEAKGNLISLSEEIEHEEASIRAFLSDVTTAALKASEEGAAVDDFLAGYREGVIETRLRTADALEDAGLADAAAELRDNAEWFPGVVVQQDVEAIFNLMAAGVMVERNLDDFTLVVEALREMHATIDQWIVTDVNVSGEQVAELVSKANEALQ